VPFPETHWFCLFELLHRQCGAVMLKVQNTIKYRPRADDPVGHFLWHVKYLLG
jgi:hypothetical protein